MSDTKLNRYIQYGTAANRALFTPDPPENPPGTPVQTLYLWQDSDGTQGLYWWTGAAWQLIAGAGVLSILTADPGSPANDTFWMVRTGTTAGSEIRLRARVGGVTFTVAAVVIT